jgi:hypothetical protein
MNDRKPSVSAYLIFSVFMLLIYLAIAVALLVFRWPEGLPEGNRIILAAAIVLYIIYRANKLRKRMKDEAQP